MKHRKYLERQQSFFLLFMVSALVSTGFFGVYYYFIGIKSLSITAFAGFGLFLSFIGLSYVSKQLVVLFRTSTLTVFVAIYLQVLYTGGITSSSLFEFVIPPLLAFFYRPVRDRYLFMGASLMAMLSFLPLSLMGYTPNLVPSHFMIANGAICGVFVFLIVATFSILFRTAIAAKNEKLGTSMRQLQETTQKLIQSEKMASLGVLSAGVAHEINNPLNFIRGGIDMLEDDLKRYDSEEKEHYITAIKEGLNRAATIVNSLGHFSRQTESMNEACDLHSILDNCIVMLQPKLKYKGNVLKHYDRTRPVMTGNEGRLHQAFLNIVSNAAHAIEDDGTIELSSKVSPKKIVIEIKDDGTGISEEHLTKISDPFFTTKPVGQGTGLGLAITYRIIEEHNGEISVSSTLGKGTKFVLSFQLI